MHFKDAILSREGWVVMALWPCAAIANPTGLTVQSGAASATASGSQLQVTASQNAVLNWQTFNIAHGERTQFIQPSSSSIVWNHIQDPNPSQIFGRLDANGVVVLMNSSGFYFGPNAFVQAAGFIVSTANAVPVESSAGLFWQFQGAPPTASIINYGQIHAGTAGSVFLIGEHIENHGSIEAPQGQVSLLAAKEVQLSSRPDGRGLSATVQLPAGSIDNQGRLIADAGSLALKAAVVNQDGFLQANSVQEHNGVIELVASESVTLGTSSVISARGDSDTPGNGGTVLVQSAGTFKDATGSRIEIQGGQGGGNGGFVEISAPEMSQVRSSIDGTAAHGGVGGRLLIDPRDIVIGNSGTGTTTGGNVGAEEPPAGTLNLSVDSAFTGFSQITLQATRNITLASGTVWDLAASTGITTPGSKLILEAGNNITIANGAAIVASGDWSVTLEAGRNFNAGAHVVTPGLGVIALNGTGSIESARGDIQLRAGNNVTVAAGSVRTTDHGNIAVKADSGNIVTGTKANGFRFLPTGYEVDADLGGISTANGGNVHLDAGQDVISYLPFAGGIQSDAGSGAFGSDPGNVIVEAGRDVAGHFVVRNGEGRISAGRDAGTASRLLALSLISRSWAVEAGRDILLQEVRNPNGLFNNLGSSLSPNRHRFDYTPDASVFLRAANSVQLRGTALPRYGDSFSQGMPPIYPGTLEIHAGAGGVELGNDVVLFPAPRGNLNVTTTDRGSVIGTKAGDLAQWIVSDSSKVQYRTFGDFGISDHGTTLLHDGDPEPVRLTIDGDMTGILLGVPKRAEVRVKGNMINSRFDGQNLDATDTTLIHVDGNIVNRNEFTSVALEVAPDFSPFSDGRIFPPLSGALAGLESRFQYDAKNKTLTFQGRMTGDELQLLLNTPVAVFDANGLPVLKPNGEPETRIVSTLPPSIATALFNASQDVPLNSDTGYRLGGGGTFLIEAHSLDLGATIGIVSQGPRANDALAERFNSGADIHVDLGGNLEMFSTKIASLNGGDIRIEADGSIRVGSKNFQANDGKARGIFTVDPSDVTVIANGDIDVNGSRIAAYDGGNVSVLSREGTVDAGTGGGGSAAVEKIVVVGGKVLTYVPTIPGSGILATTFPASLDAAFPASLNTVGNIQVAAPKGDIIASSGGIVQIPLNGVGQNAGTVTLTAGTRDAAGNVIHKGSIDARGSGVIGSTVKLDATGDIDGLVVARSGIDLIAQQNINVTALAQGNVNIEAGGNVSGTIIGIGGISASGATVDAALLSQNVTASGDTSSSQVGFTTGTAAAAASQSLSSDEQTKAGAPKETKEADEPKRTLAAAPKLTRTVGRVTVILPNTP